MSLYEHTIVASQDTSSESQLNNLKDKYSKIN